MEAGIDVGARDDEMMESVEAVATSVTVDPAAISMDADTLMRPPSSIFEYIDEPTLPTTKLLADPSVVGDEDGSSNSVPTSSLASTDDVSIPYDTFDTTEPTRKMEAQVVIPLPKLAALPYSTNQSGLVYDVRMRFHAEIIAYDDKDNDFHPEDPRRIHEIFTELKKAGLVVDDTKDESPEDAFKLWRIAAREATPAEIILAHTPEHYEWVRSLPEKSNDELVQEADSLDSVYLHKLTFFCAKLSAGGAIEACRAVVAGQIKNAIAVIRPPGHHAESFRPGGFCFFNNVCVATKVCQRDFPDLCRKVLILDWDVHHGNGVQEVFYNDPNVLYISLHVHRDGQFYPPGPYGNHKHCGQGEGLGYNVNIPWPSHGMTDGDYLFAFQRAVMPIAQEFDPDLVIISAGFDAAEGDELGRCHVSPAGYAHMTHMLMSLAKGKIAVCLEGGYNLRSIAKSALAVTRTLMGEPPDRILDTEPTANGVDTVHMVIRQQSRFWKRLYPPDSGSILKDRIGGIGTVTERMHDVVRAWQTKVLWDDFKMRPLPIIRDRLSKSFENQVIATPNYEDKVPLLVIFHDPPEVVGVPNARTNKLELHNTWLADVSKTYVDWAVRHGFAVLDVNIPKHYTEPDDTGDYVESEDHETRAALTRELANYLWDNYIYPNEAEYLFIIGIGDAYSGLIHLLNHNENCSDNIDFIFSFVADNVLQSVRKQTDDNVSDWYHKHSLVFVSDEHAAWAPERARKLRKKYGALVRSPRTSLNEMLAEHQEQVFNVMLDQTKKWREAREASKRTLASPTRANGGSGLNISGMRLASSAKFDEEAESSRRRARTGASGSPVPGGLRSPNKLPPMGTFEITTSPLRSPATRQAR